MQTAIYCYFYTLMKIYAHTLIGISRKTYTVSAANIYYACHRFDSDRKKFRSSVEEQQKSTVSVYVACFPNNNTALAAMILYRRRFPIRGCEKIEPCDTYSIKSGYTQVRILPDLSVKQYREISAQTANL